jgi:hypothetical protein
MRGTLCKSNMAGSGALGLLFSAAAPSHTVAAVTSAPINYFKMCPVVGTTTCLHHAMIAELTPVRCMHNSAGVLAQLEGVWQVH